MQDKDDGLWIDIETHDQELTEEVTSNITELIDGMPSYIAKAINKCKEEKLLENYLNNKEFLEMIAEDYGPMFELQLHDQKLTEAVTDEVIDKSIESLIRNFNFTNEQLKTASPEVSDERINKIRDSIKTK